MKKIFCVMVLAWVIIGVAFAQQKQPAPTQPAPKQPAAPAQPAQTPAPAAAAPQDKKDAIALDLFQLAKGVIAIDSDNDINITILSAAYERLVAPHFSIGGDAEMYFITFGTSGFYFSLAVEGRYYPSADFDKFFLGATLGFNLLGVGEEGFMGLTTSLKTGYKLVFPNKNIYVEPSLAYVLSKSTSIFPTPLGWNGGLRLGFMF